MAEEKFRRKQIKAGETITLEVDEKRSTLEVKVGQTALPGIMASLKTGDDPVKALGVLFQELPALEKTVDQRGAELLEDVKELEKKAPLKEKSLYQCTGESLEQLCRREVLKDADRRILSQRIGLRIVDQRGREVFESGEYEYGPKKKIEVFPEELQIGRRILYNMMKSRGAKATEIAGMLDTLNNVYSLPLELRIINMEILEDMIAKGKPWKEIKEGIDLTRKESNQLQYIKELSDGGLSYAAIARQVNSEWSINLTAKTVARWVSGERSPRHLAIAQKSIRARDKRIHSGFSTERAYLEGVYTALGSAERGPPFRPTSTDMEFLDSIKSTIEVVTGETPKCHYPKQEKPQLKGDVKASSGERKKGEEYGYVECSKRYFVEPLKDITCGKTRVPWEHLVTDEERKEFLRGFLRVLGSVSTRPIDDRKYPRLTISKESAPRSLMTDLQILFKRGGITSRLFDTARGPQVIIEGSYNLQKLLDEHIITSQEDRSNLETRLSETKDRVRVYTPQEYDTVMGYEDSEEHKSAKWTAIGKACGIECGVEPIPRLQVTQWLEKGVKPPLVKALEEIEDIEARNPDVDVIGFVYRHIRANSTFARIIARRHNMQEVQEMVDYLGEEEVKKKPTLLAYTLEEVKQKQENGRE